MSGFDLVPVGGGDPIHLPPGETVLGRGPFLGISDKRVSRLHGLLENVDGRLRLKPTHLNPCFVQSSLTDDPRPLQRDSWHPLHDGDLFSLLPGQFVFRVAAVGGGGDGTPRNSQMFEEEEELPVSPKPDVEPRPPVELDHGETSALTNQDEAGGSEMRSKKVEVKHLSEPRRRVLPAWMMAAVAAAHSSSSSPKVQSAGKKKKAAAATPTSTKRAAARQVKTSSPEEAELSEEERPVKRRRKIQDDEEEEEEEAVKSKTDVPSATVQPRTESIRPEVSDESDSFTMEEEKEERDVSNQKPPTPAVSRPESDATTLRNGRQMTESVGSNGGSASGPAPSRVRLRTPCPYGKDCYRKNPLHFQESSHPGDSDYEEEEEEEEAASDRPECPYGTDCYRKNPLHRKEFKHTEKPASTRRSVQKKAPADDEDEDEDSGDDDSFINDDSEDAGDDSDYVPLDSDDSGKEDVKRLQREAKAFVKGRK